MSDRMIDPLNFQSVLVGKLQIRNSWRIRTIVRKRNICITPTWVWRKNRHSTRSPASNASFQPRHESKEPQPFETAGLRIRQPGIGGLPFESLEALDRAKRSRVGPGAAYRHRRRPKKLLKLECVRLRSQKGPRSRLISVAGFGPANRKKLQLLELRNGPGAPYANQPKQNNII